MTTTGNTHDALEHRDCWIFDLDGTLTVAMHDFDGIRAALELPPGRPILEELARLPKEVALQKARTLDLLEAELAGQARAAEGARLALERLSDRGSRMGILTRNTKANALVTLEAIGMRELFLEQDVIGRGEALPKPNPDGLLHLLAGWSAQAERAVMVGDYLFDLLAGRRAGTMTVLVDPEGRFEHAHAADACVERLDLLIAS
jgi:HAD superfamily hydrolase (TIGR01509 family)